MVNHELGYAGRVDCIGWVKLEATQPQLRAMIDWKTHYSREGCWRPYEEYAWQLAGYRLALGEEFGVCANLVISTNPDIPGVLEHIWTPEQLAHGEDIFRTALNFWRLIKNSRTSGRNKHRNSQALRTLMLRKTTTEL